MVTRDQIAAALATVPGLTASPTKTGPVSPGDAWPVWKQTRWGNPVPLGIRLATWDVLVVLPDQGADVTVGEADPLIELVGMALIEAGLQIDLVEPVRFGASDTATGVPALRYQAHD